MLMDKLLGVSPIEQEIREWVRQRQRLDSKVALVDFDKLAWMEGAPPGTQGQNWHYQVGGGGGGTRAPSQRFAAQSTCPPH